MPLRFTNSAFRCLNAYFLGATSATIFLDMNIGVRISNMNGMRLVFVQRVVTSRDAMNNAVYTDTEITVDDCLVAPITEPTNVREQQALMQSRDQIRIHLPKTFTGDVSNSDVDYAGKTFHVDSDNVVFMEDNTPGRWNRYTRGESVNA